MVNFDPKPGRTTTAQHMKIIKVEDAPCPKGGTHNPVTRELDKPPYYAGKCTKCNRWSRRLDKELNGEERDKKRNKS